MVLFKGCEPVKIWMVIRHGTRLPSRSLINDMTNKLPRLRDRIIHNSATSSKLNLSVYIAVRIILYFVEVQLSEEALEAIRDWHLQIKPEDAKILSYEGEDEMLNLAERMQMRFPTILSNIYSNTSYKVSTYLQ